MYSRVLYEGEVYSRLGLSIKHLVGMVWYARCELPFACLLRAARMDTLQQADCVRKPKQTCIRHQQPLLMSTRDYYEKWDMYK